MTRFEPDDEARAVVVENEGPWEGPWEAEPEVEAPSPEEIIAHELPDYKGMSLTELGGESPTCFLTGVAGTGKTYLVRQHINRDPSFGVLCATTGVAAINLGAGVPTIHSLLGFGNTQGAEDSYQSGNMLRRIRQIGDQGVRWIIADEASMLHYKVLDFITLALDDYNNTYEGRQPLGLMLTGDLLQLSPVPDKLIGPNGRYVVSKSGKEINEPTPWLFQAECWSRFERNTIKLTEVRRQSDPLFIEGLNLIRSGDGPGGVAKLIAAGASTRMLLNNSFDGTTIVATNAEVDRFNNASLLKVEGEPFVLTSTRWYAKQYEPSEWKNVPEKGKFKVGALVMILQNDPSKLKQYVNGDLAHVVSVRRLEDAVPTEEPTDFSFKREGEPYAVELKLLRTGENIFITKTIRPTYQLNEPDLDSIPPSPSKAKIRKDRVPGMTRRVWIMGELEYFPIRLAYATTVHKSQGLTLDRVQIHPKDYFFGHPQMAYVALSRCRSASGLVIVGGEKLLASKVNTDPILARWM